MDFFSTLWRKAHHLTTGRFWVIAVPYIWLILFFVVPFLIVFRVSLSEEVLGVPPYTDLFQWSQDAALTIVIKLKNYRYLMADSLYIDSYLSSITNALITTLWALLLGFPMAYGIVKLRPKFQIIVLLLVIIPFWTSFLIRIYAWLNLLTPYGLINRTLMYVGLVDVDAPLPLLFNTFAVVVGMVYCYVPFMILPCYVALEKMDRSLLEAASDLGAQPFRIFYSIVVPLALPGVLTGCLLVFIPCVGEFVIPEILGGSDTVFIGRLVWNEFFLNRSWPTAAALACTLLIVLFIPIYGLQYLQSRYAKKLDA